MVWSGVFSPLVVEGRRGVGDEGGILIRRVPVPWTPPEPVLERPPEGQWEERGRSWERRSVYSVWTCQSNLVFKTPRASKKTPLLLWSAGKVGVSYRSQDAAGPAGAACCLALWLRPVGAGAEVGPRPLGPAYAVHRVSQHFLNWEVDECYLKRGQWRSSVGRAPVPSHGLGDAIRHCGVPCPPRPRAGHRLEWANQTVSPRLWVERRRGKYSSCPFLRPLLRQPAPRPGRGSCLFLSRSSIRT